MSTWRATARLLLFAVLATGAACAAPSWAEDTSGLASIPAFTGLVVDSADVISETRQAQLESFLDQLQKKTGAQFAVLTVATCAPEDPSTYKTRVFNTWGIGDKERKDGLLLLVAMQEHKLIFETGYGLEGTLPDGWQSRMLRDLAIPAFKAGDPAEGITAAVLSSAQRIAAEKNVTLEWDGKELRYNSTRGGGIPSWIVLLVFFFIFFVLLPAIRASRGGRGGGWYSSGGGWGGGFGGFGGGFGGGGGGVRRRWRRLVRRWRWRFERRRRWRRRVVNPRGRALRIGDGMTQFIAACRTRRHNRRNR